MTKHKPAKVAFDLLSSDELMSHIAGAAVSGLIAEMTQEAPTNVRRWMEKGFPSEERFDDFLDALPEDAGAHARAIKDGSIAYPSPLGSYLYPALDDDWTHHEATLARLHRCAEMDIRTRCLVPRYTLQALLQCLWGCPLRDEERIPAEGTTHSAEVSTELIKELTEDRASIVRMAYFSTLASLDIEVCRRIFPKNELRMIFLTVMPSIRKRKGMPRHTVTPERKFADLLYCSVLNADYPPRLEDMLGLSLECKSTTEWSAVSQLKDRFKDGTVEWADFNRLFNAWSTLLPADKGPFNQSKPAEWGALNLEKSQYDFFWLLFVAMKAFSFALKRTPGKRSEAEVCAFHNEYIEAWHGRVRYHGLELGVGKPWGATKMEQIIFNAQENSATG